MRTHRIACTLATAAFASIALAARLGSQQVVKPPVDRVDAAEPGRLASPGELSAVQTSATEIVLKWAPVSGAAGYRLFGPAPNAPGGERALGTTSVTGRHWVVPITPALRAAGPLRFAIEAMGTRAGLTSERVPFPTVTVQGPAPGGTGGTGQPRQNVMVVTARVVGSRGVDLSWTPLREGSITRITRQGGNTADWTLCQPCTSRMDGWKDDAVLPGQSYTYFVSVTAARGARQEYRSNTVTIPPAGGTGGAGGTPADSGDTSGAKTPPPAVASARMAFNGASTVVLTWAASPGATQYRVERAVGSGEWMPLATVPASVTGLADTMALLGSVNPRYRIVAVNAAGASPVTTF